MALDYWRKGKKVLRTQRLQVGNLCSGHKFGQYMVACTLEARSQAAKSLKHEGQWYVGSFLDVFVKSYKSNELRLEPERLHTEMGGNTALL